MSSKVTLIRPPALTNINEVALFAIPPLGLAYIAGSILDAGFVCDFIDAVGENLKKSVDFQNEHYTSHGLTITEIVKKIDPATRYIGLSFAYTKEWPSYKALAKAIKQKLPSVIIICGGEHITAEPLFSMKDCGEIDYCILGEGEETFVELIQSLDKNIAIESVTGIVFRRGRSISENVRRSRKRNIDDIPWPAWHLLPLENYLSKGMSFGVNRGRSIPILGTRGCPFQCTFCSSKNMWTTRWIPRNEDLLLEEMEYYIKEYNVANFDFFDLNAIVNQRWMLSFLNKLINKKWNITWQLPTGTRTEVINRELCELLYQSGCRNISFSPESGSGTILKKIKKRVSLKHLGSAIYIAHKSKLNVKANLIFGFPDETHREIWESLWFIVKMSFFGLHDLSIWSFAPYPGTELYSRLKKKGELSGFDKEYLDSISYAQVTQSKSWNHAMNVQWINFYRLFGVGLFYTTNFLFRPFRLIKILINLSQNRHESRCEKFIIDVLKESKNFFKASSPQKPLEKIFRHIS
jgi:radical SAM superfamily enzyme YgiQ (UPF0313 family)